MPGSTDALMKLDEAIAIARRSITAIRATERIRLLDACGRILATDVRACLDVPPYDNSAMDGFALYLADLPADTSVRLPLAGQIVAGHPYPGPVPRGAAVRINTGSMMPEGPDAVVMQEDCQIAPDQSWIELSPRVIARLKSGENIRRRGEDTRTGTVLLPKGRRLCPQDVALLAGQGIDRVEVVRRLRVAVASTGDELYEPGAELPRAGIHDSNRYMLISLLRRPDFVVTDLGILHDDRDSMLPIIQDAAMTHDVLLTSGGVSVGNADIVKEVIAALGQIELWRLAIKPGKPVMYGRIENCMVIGLPGNPVAVMVVFLLFARPLLFALSGAAPEAPLRLRATADFELHRKPGRREWLRARWRLDPVQGPLVSVYYTDSSGVLSSLSWADGLVELPEECRNIALGDTVEYLPFSGLGLE